MGKKSVIIEEVEIKQCNNFFGGENMRFIEQYEKYNDFFQSYLNSYIKKCKQSDSYDNIRFLKDLEEKSVDLEGITYKLLVDEVETIDLENDNYKLLPIGLINLNVITKFIGDANDLTGIRRGSFKKMLFDEPKYGLFYYSNDEKTISNGFEIPESFKKLCESYITHYRETLGEVWSEKDFYNMLESLKYLVVKYALNVNTGELMAIGFFGSQVRCGAGGETLTNAELYVMPEFRGCGIAKKMVGLSFEVARMDGITDFDSITYRTPTMDALSFWNSIGAEVSGLYHIEGNISEIIEQIEAKTVRK